MSPFRTVFCVDEQNMQLFKIRESDKETFKEYVTLCD